MVCYDKKTYNELLYNGQIIKKNETCGNEYEINCGIIDTLEQQLCIKSNEKCPLYDIGIGEMNNENYEYIKDANIYYNKEDFKGKKIIGKLLLNDGQPCYRINEKLWRKFFKEEDAESHLKCDLEIFGNLTDNRYVNKGNISFKIIYNDNLNNPIKHKILGKIKDENVSLFQREFLGIDKECDKRLHLSKNKFEKLEYNQKMEKLLILVEGIFSLSIYFVVFLILMILKCKGVDDISSTMLFILLIIYIPFNFAYIICHAVFLGKIIHNKSYYYNCSDSITNEILRQEYEKIKKSIKLGAPNLCGDILVFICLLIVSFFFFCECKHEDRYDNNNKIYKNKEKGDEIFIKACKNNDKKDFSKEESIIKKSIKNEKGTNIFDDKTTRPNSSTYEPTKNEKHQSSN